MMTSGGMQCVSSSYRRARTSNSLRQTKLKHTITVYLMTTLQLLSEMDLFAQSLLPLRALLAHDGVSRFPEVDHPVCHWDFLVCRERVPGHWKYGLNKQIFLVFI